MDHPLDNPVWNALRTGNKNLARGNGYAKYFSAHVAPFVGLKENTIEHLRDLHPLLRDRKTAAILSLHELNIPDCWSVLHRFDIYQMVLEKHVTEQPTGTDVVPLTQQHVREMIKLTAMTNPGPFMKHTIDFGFYEGIFHEGKLVAMAGQRMHPVPYAEVSAVCTHPDFTGRGFARQLILRQIHRMQSSSFIPYLHVRSGNTGAIRLYEHLGFTIRKEIVIYFLDRG